MICRIGESVNVDVVALRVVDLPNPGVELVVGDTAPVGWLFVVDRFSAVHVGAGAGVRVHVHDAGVADSGVVPRAISWWRGLGTMVKGILKIKQMAGLIKVTLGTLKQKLGRPIKEKLSDKNSFKKLSIGKARA